MLEDPVFLDASAIVKLITEEAETSALIDRLAELSGQMITSQISEIECARAVARIDPDLLPTAARIFDDLMTLPLTSAISLRAAYLQPTRLRRLDAIQLATAVELQPSLSCFVSYDQRLSEAASGFGLVVECPSP